MRYCDEIGLSSQLIVGRVDSRETRAGRDFQPLALSVGTPRSALGL